MSKQKKPLTRIDTIVNASTRSEKTSWNRKRDNMNKLLLQLEGVNEEIFDLILSKKTPIIDEISALRTEMVRDCIHPEEFLVEEDGFYYCKFCEKRINV